tara:strand:- start:2472 stop:4631 length:2160 start_codon:yes stop_codon:yes gene_type:complete
MSGLKWTVLLTILTLTIFSVNSSKANTTCVTNSLGDRTCTTVTGNILSNSTFGTGNTTTTTDWSTTGSDGIHTHGNFGNFPYGTGMDTSGGVLAFEGHDEDNVFQDSALVGDGHLTQSQINEGFVSTMSADVWFWNNIENTFTMKQTITAADGTVTTQTRVINDNDPNRVFNSGQFTNYTDSYTQNPNSQTDFTIRAEVFNLGDGSNNDNQHRGPDVDNVQLSITTLGQTTSCQQLGTCTSAGTDLNNALDLKDDTTGIDLFEQIDQDVETAIEDFQQAEFNNEVNLPTTMDFGIVDMTAIEELEVIVPNEFGGFDEIPLEVFVVESFDNFIDTNDLRDTFEQELVVQDISEQEFFNELSSQMAEELTMEMNFDRPLPPMEMPMDDLPPIEMPMETDMMTEMPELIEIPEDEMFGSTGAEIDFGSPNMMTEMPEPEMIEEDFDMVEPPMEMETMTEETMVTSLPPGMREPEMEEPETIREEIPNVRNEPMTEENTVEEEPAMAEPSMADEPQPEEPNANNTTSNNEPTDTETIEENETGRPNTMETETQSEETPNETRMAENTEAEGEETKTNNEERVDARETDTTETADVKVRTTENVQVSSIGIKVAKIIAKLELTLKRVDDKVKAIQYVTLKGIQSEAPNLNLYAKKQFYQPTSLQDGNPDFFNQLNIEQQQIYGNVTLAQYSDKDPLIVQKRELNRINSEKQRLLIEIQQLKENL